MTIEDARAIAVWRYEPPHDFYNWDGVEQISAVPEGYVSVASGGNLIGFFCFGVEARVPGCQLAGCYADDALDVGLGLRPDLTGRGFGLVFVRAGLDYAVERFLPNTLRLTVASFNTRAIRVYEQAGFVQVYECTSGVHGVATRFVVMRRRLTTDERVSDAVSR
jgi:RimJ/RimL family protein N-acetyltransferase